MRDDVQLSLMEQHMTDPHEANRAYWNASAAWWKEKEDILTKEMNIQNHRILTRMSGKWFILTLIM